MIEYFNGATLAAPKVPLSHGALVGGWLHVAGMVARTPSGEILEGDIESATLQCLENMEAVIASKGGDRAAVVKINVYLTSLGDYEGMNRVFERFFNRAYPARTTVKVAGLGLGRVELDAVAYLDSVS